MTLEMLTSELSLPEIFVAPYCSQVQAFCGRRGDGHGLRHCLLCFDDFFFLETLFTSSFCLDGFVKNLGLAVTADVNLTGIFPPRSRSTSDPFRRGF